MRTSCSIAFAGVASALVSSWPASAQFGDGLTQAALAVQAFDKSADRCFYEPIVGRALDRLREHYAQAEPYRWRRAVRESVDADDMVRNLMGLAMQGSPYTADPRISGPSKPVAAPADKDCAASGLSVGAALPFAGSLIGFDPGLFGEADRLMKGEGRSLLATSSSPLGKDYSSTTSPTQPRGSVATDPSTTLYCKNSTSEYKAVYDRFAKAFFVDETRYNVLAVEETRQSMLVTGLSVNDGPFFRAELRPERKIEFYVGSRLIQTDACR